METIFNSLKTVNDFFSKHVKNNVIQNLDLQFLNTNEEKKDFIYELLFSLKKDDRVIIRVLFWEKECKIEKLLQDMSHETCIIYKTYDNKDIPGILFIDTNLIQYRKNISDLLMQHLNFELAIEPSLNIRVQILLNKNVNPLILDIYDDRGLNLVFS